MSQKWLLPFVCILVLQGCLDNSSTGPEDNGSIPFRALAGSDTTVSANDTVRLHGGATDSDAVTELAWQLEPGGAFVMTPGGDTAFAAPAGPNIYQYVLRATAGAGNIQFDTVAVTVMGGTSGPVQDTTDVMIYGFAGRVKRIRTESTDIVSPGELLNLNVRRVSSEIFFDLTGNLTKRDTYTKEGTLENRVVYTYDPVGNVTERKLLDAAGRLLEGYSYIYNGNGDIVASRQYMDNDSAKVEFTYDAGGKLASVSYFDGGGALQQRELLTRNIDGSIDKIEFHDQTDTLLGTVQHIYDSHQNLLQELFINPDKSLLKANIYEYNDRDDLTMSTVVENSVVTEKKLYAYDVEGNITEYSEYQGDTLLLGRETIAYDTAGYMATYRLYQGDGTLTVEENYKYDQYGNITRYKIAQPAQSQQLSESYIYEYDIAGNWTKRSIYQPDAAGVEKIVTIEFQVIIYY